MTTAIRSRRRPTTWETVGCLLMALAARAIAAAQTPATNPRAVQPERPTVVTHANSVNRPAPGAAGIGDLSVGVKWRLVDHAPVLGRFAIQPGLKMPSGSLVKGKGTNTTDLNLLFISSHTLSAVLLDVNVGTGVAAATGPADRRMRPSGRSLSVGRRGAAGLGWANSTGFPARPDRPARVRSSRCWRDPRCRRATGSCSTSARSSLSAGLSRARSMAASCTTPGACGGRAARTSPGRDVARRTRRHLHRDAAARLRIGCRWWRRSRRT